jgi:hypothetical protein
MIHFIRKEYPPDHQINPDFQAHPENITRMGRWVWLFICSVARTSNELLCENVEVLFVRLEQILALSGSVCYRSGFVVG